MKKVFISQPMRGLTEKDIEEQREKAIDEVTEKIWKQEQFVHGMVVIDSYIKDAPQDAGPLWYLGAAIQKMAEADIAIFIGDWKNYRGCRCEHKIAEEYGIPIFDMNER